MNDNYCIAITVNRLHQSNMKPQKTCSIQSKSKLARIREKPRTQVLIGRLLQTVLESN